MSPERHPDREPGSGVPRAKVVLLAGPSGCGKTYLADRSRLPTVALDDFYRDGTEPGLPHRADGTVDWEDPRTWNADAAVAALAALCATGRVDVPTYAFGRNAVVGHRVIDRGDSLVVVAEGLFAADLVEPLTDAGLLADALLMIRTTRMNALRRLWRDLREHRKPPAEVIRVGREKSRTEPELLAHNQTLGCRPVTKPQAKARLATLGTTWHRGPAT
ncbi:MAG: uridine kinase [Acidimicrobiales bacterium]|nr:uridine kinase [Acidimicrobiales bacterium]